MSTIMYVYSVLYINDYTSALRCKRTHLLRLELLLCHDVDVGSAHAGDVGRLTTCKQQADRVTTQAVATTKQGVSSR